MVRTRKAGFAHCFWQNLKLDIFWETESKGKKGVTKKERCTKSEEHERVMKEREAGERKKGTAREREQHVLTEGPEHF